MGLFGRDRDLPRMVRVSLLVLAEDSDPVLGYRRCHFPVFYLRKIVLCLDSGFVECHQGG